jgi:hypothetical protein
MALWMGARCQTDVPYSYAKGEGTGMRARTLARGETNGTLVEVEVPAFFVGFYGHPVLTQADVPDLTPFISRMTPVDLTSAFSPVDDVNQLPWKTGVTASPA